ncbi:uncharacterized protein LOC110253110 [Exaiptasia diaphana]|uniref:Uncharacterized protein n=1 Tax=Exaiptasia diaphana TaxID=2652724 RepID=A0A913YVE6_EXADI|nr:uncharacterized protein LOC110253110 [Exaiptasia diaphana]
MSSPHSPEPVIEETIYDQSPSREPFDERNVVEEEVFPCSGSEVFSEPTRRMDDFELLRQHWDEIDDELQFKNDVGEGIDACAHQPAIESDIPRVSPISLVPEVQPFPEPSSPAPPPPKSESSMIGVAYYYPPPKPVPEKPMEECPDIGQAVENLVQIPN